MSYDWDINRGFKHIWEKRSYPDWYRIAWLKECPTVRKTELIFSSAALGESFKFAWTIHLVSKFIGGWGRQRILSHESKTHSGSPCLMDKLSVTRRSQEGGFHHSNSTSFVKFDVILCTRFNTKFKKKKLFSWKPLDLIISKFLSGSLILLLLNLC